MSIKSSSSYKWLVLAISFALMLVFAISLQSLPPIFDKMQLDIAFSNSQAGMLMGAYAIPGIFIPFLIAFLASRYNNKYRHINSDWWISCLFYQKHLPAIYCLM